MIYACRQLGLSLWEWMMVFCVSMQVVCKTDKLTIKVLSGIWVCQSVWLKLLHNIKNRFMINDYFDFRKSFSILSICQDRQRILPASVGFTTTAAIIKPHGCSELKGWRIKMNSLQQDKRFLKGCSRFNMNLQTQHEPQQRKPDHCFAHQTATGNHCINNHCK